MGIGVATLAGGVLAIGLLPGCQLGEVPELDAEGVGLAAGTILAAQAKHPAAVELQAELIVADKDLGTGAKPPDDYIPMTPKSTSGPAYGNVVLLFDPAGEIAVPIFIGGTEALSIQLRLAKRRYARPLTHDLLDSMLGRLDVKMLRAQVDRLEGNVYIGTVVLRQGNRVISLDARPSDAIALAIGNEVPIYVSQQLVDKAGVKLDELDHPRPDKGTDPISL
ncbi:MAG: bifunctional nuclease family protein [Deltaproteobacteria bacterium]|nr:bifunctional nuclease family protein [Deltaproteobacteria bacterium]